MCLSLLFQPHSDEYSFLVYDGFERTMKGNFNKNNKYKKIFEKKPMEYCVSREKGIVLSFCGPQHTTLLL